MASGKDNLLLQNISGKIGNGYVVKQYPGGKIVIARLPRKYKRTTTELTELYQERFKAAVKYARQVLSSNELMAPYQGKTEPGQRLYNYLIREYMMEERRKAGQSPYKKYRR
jgi:hypothetical protein